MAVNLSPIWGAGAQLLDNSGNVLSGGKIYTYAAGTTTPATTYTSFSGGTANSNPIILNSAGRVPYEIWLTDGVSYKFVLKDSNDTLIATYDNLTGINSNFIAYTSQQEIQTATAGQTVFNLTTMQYQPGTNNLAVYVDGVNQYGPGAQYAFVETDSDTVTFVSGLHVGASVKFTTATPVASSATDAANVSYTPPFTGSVGTNVQDKLAQTVSVIDFGADPTGVADSTDAINEAITQADVVIIPEGTYRCDDTIEIYDDYKTVILQGTVKRLTAYSASTRPVVRIKGNYCSFQGVGPASTVWSENNAPHGVFLWGSENPGDPLGSDAVNSRHVNVSNFRIRTKDALGNGIALALLSSEAYSSGALYDGIFSNLVLVGGQYQLYLNPDVNGNTFNNINFYETRAYGLYLDGISGGLITDNQFCNFFSDAAVANTYTYYGRYVLLSSFTNMGGEPGSGAYKNFDATCGSLSWIGYDNHPSGGSWLATDSLYFANGSFIADDLNLNNDLSVTDTIATTYLNASGADDNSANTTSTGYSTRSRFLYFRNRGNTVGIGGKAYANQVIANNGSNVDLEIYTINGGCDVVLGTDSTARTKVTGTAYIPATDGTYNLGAAGNRWGTVYAATGTINTSDATTKEDIVDLSEAEKRVAIKLKSSIKRFKYIGRNRKHFGVIAQDVKAAFESENLVAEEYGVFCADVLEDGSTRLGIRYDELFAFIIGAL